ncbi:hypothetical protein AB833_21195 [Chromatiales bacterium (ex Bugula neritina AB1)]|nr:hypothetical protein AB833_21195 [Chromatiales bacterium (ex Bugula neritina AB1)]
MGNTVNAAATYEDLFNIPDNEVGEIFGGKLVTHPRPAPRHALATSMVGAGLIHEFGSRRSGGDPGEWWILDEPECHLGSDIVVPDLAGWRKTTMPELPETAWFETPPDWVCEVLSPSTAKYDRGVKREIYARESVGYYWIVDPLVKLIEVFALQQCSWALVNTGSDEQVVNLVPFETLPFDLSILWV